MWHVRRKPYRRVRDCQVEHSNVDRGPRGVRRQPSRFTRLDLHLRGLDPASCSSERIETYPRGGHVSRAHISLWWYLWGSLLQVLMPFPRSLCLSHRPFIILLFSREVTNMKWPSLWLYFGYCPSHTKHLWREFFFYPPRRDVFVLACGSCGPIIWSSTNLSIMHWWHKDLFRTHLPTCEVSRN